MGVSSRIMVQHIGRVVVIDFLDAAIMDTLQIQQISEELYELVDKQDHKYILLDFSNVRFLSSQTLGALINLHKKLTARKGWFGICGLKRELHNIFELTQLDKIFNFYKNEPQALEAAGV